MYIRNDSLKLSLARCVVTFTRHPACQVWGILSSLLRLCRLFLKLKRFNIGQRTFLLCLLETFNLLKFLNWQGNKIIVIKTKSSLLILLFWKRIFSHPTFKIFFYLSVLLWKYFDSGGKICCLWRKHFFLSGVDIFCSYCSNVHTRDEIFPHKRRNIQKPETNYFHTSLESLCPCWQGRAACLLQPKELHQYEYRIQISLGLVVRVQISLGLGVTHMS